MKKEIPILFSAPMVEALLAGRKTMTRRVIKPQPIDNTEIDGNFFHGNHKGYVKVDGHPNWQQQFAHEFARWQPGDLLWVRETFRKYLPTDEDGEINHSKGEVIEFAADKPEPMYLNDGDGFIATKKDGSERFVPFKPSIHMPKALARIWLEVIEVRVERLQNISPADACDEGIEYWNIDGEALAGGELQADFKNYTWTERKEKDQKYEDRYFPTFASCVDSFRTLWQSINGEEGWIENPWVWVISFKVLSTTGKP